MNMHGRRRIRDPHFYWKVLNIVLDVVILVLTGFILWGGRRGGFIYAALFLGILTSAFEGIMQLAKGRRVLGYFCSVVAGAMAVALILSILLSW